MGFFKSLIVGMDGYQKINPEEAKSLMSQNCIILDVRMDYEYEEGHIANAVLLPVQEIEEKAESILMDKDQLILVYCRSGQRSKKAAEKLIRKGYTNVKDFGGIIQWPYEITK